MKTTCPKCQTEYDDTYQDTGCPHNKFDMHTLVTRGKDEGCAHTPEELVAFTEGDGTAPLPNPDCPVQAMLRESRGEIIANLWRPATEEPDEETDRDSPGDTVSVYMEIAGEEESQRAYGRYHWPTKDWCWRTDDAEWPVKEWRRLPPGTTIELKEYQATDRVARNRQEFHRLGHDAVNAIGEYIDGFEKGDWFPRDLDGRLKQAIKKLLEFGVTTRPLTGLEREQLAAAGVRTTDDLLKEISELTAWKDSAVPILTRYSDVADIIGGDVGESRVEQLEQFVLASIAQNHALDKAAKASALNYDNLLAHILEEQERNGKDAAIAVLKDHIEASSRVAAMSGRSEALYEAYTTVDSTSIYESGTNSRMLNTLQILHRIRDRVEAIGKMKPVPIKVTSQNIVDMGLNVFGLHLFLESVGARFKPHPDAHKRNSEPLEFRIAHRGTRSVVTLHVLTEADKDAHGDEVTVLRLGMPKTPRYVFREGETPVAYQVWKTEESSLIHEACAQTPRDREFPLYQDDLDQMTGPDDIHCDYCNEVITQTPSPEGVLRQEPIPEFLVKVDFEIPPTRGIQAIYFADDETKPDEYYKTTALHGIYPGAIARGITRKVKPEPDSSKGGCA